MASCFNKLKLFVIRLISKFYLLDSRDDFMLSNWQTSQQLTVSIYSNDYICNILPSLCDNHYTVNSIYPRQNTQYSMSTTVYIYSFELHFELLTHDIRILFNIDSWHLLCPNKTYKYQCTGKETCLLHVLIFALYRRFEFNSDTKKFIEYSLNKEL